MALFQVSVLKKYLKLQDDLIIDKAYKKFTAYFQHPEIQENIRSSKEEQFQATFLNELFVKILGYTMNPNPSYNLTTEYKNEKNARKADGAILHAETAIGVIELKGTNTKHLEGIRQQAFDYKANQKGCVYVITSNFEKLRFYINDATEFLEFDLFELNPYDFSLLWLCLQKENIMNGLPLKIKEDSLVVEEAITKEFYKDYSIFKRELYRDLVRKNAKNLKTFRSSEINSDSENESLQNDVSQLEKNVKLNLFKKSQKLIDRFLFIFFAEDRGLLPPNSIHKILADWNKLKELDAHVPLYDRFKLYFNYLDTGRKGSEKRAEIFAYNGGLFKPDAILDIIEIDDELLHKHTAQLAKYDFESQVDVNILGHIFENSLNEIESVNAEIEGGDFDKQKSKRKKDGVFYTPKYITKYIVENTVGKLCEEKKIELGFKEEEYYKGRKRRQKETLEALVKILDDYRAWLLQLTICDPACGSGAFLNQALDFLIKEHRYIDELKAKLLGGGLVFSDIENTILENNIYGVDINEESVEIAKLSLWLRTAQPHRKLNDLSSNIKCGNSLIEDKKVAGDKAFKWEEEFPEIFKPSLRGGTTKQAGFDVVIGNPPYVQYQLEEKMKDFLTQNYTTIEGKPDLYRIFIERSIVLLNDNSRFSFITPNSFLTIPSAQKLRSYLKNKIKMTNIVNFEGQVFSGVSINAVIFVCKTYGENQDLMIINDESPFPNANSLINASELSINYNNYLESDSINIGFSEKSENLVSKIIENSVKLYEIADYTLGMQVYHNTMHSKDEIKSRFYHSDVKSNSTFIPEIGGKNLGRYQMNLETTEYVSYGEWCYNKPDEKYIQGERILIREIPGQKHLKCSIITEEGVPNKAIIIIKSKVINNYQLIGLLNSRLLGYYVHATTEKGKQKLFPRISLTSVKNLPVKVDGVDIIGVKAKEISFIYRELNIIDSKFQKFITSKSLTNKLSKKLQNWHELEFGEFIKELNKAIKASNKVREKAAKDADCQAELVEVLTKKDEFEWMELFEENKKKAVALQQQITATDREIDQMVYELYGLTEEEIAIVESN